MTRFHVQLEHVPTLLRMRALPQSPVAGLKERAEMMFANLRKMIVIDQVEKVLHNAGTDGADFDHDFKRRWLVSCGLDDEDVRFNVTAVNECICNRCFDGYDKTFLGTAYHVHWQTADRHNSIAVFGASKTDVDDWVVLRVQDLPQYLERAEDYVLAIGWDIDDALHECSLTGAEYAELVLDVEARVQRTLQARTAAHIGHNIRAEWIEKARRIECRVTLRAGEGQTEQIVAGRQLR